MKIVGFEANGGLHLGVVEGDQVVDLQAVDASIPSDLGEVLRRGNGDLTASVEGPDIWTAGGQARQGRVPRPQLS
jgi:hypothetical protein